jgi:hypothetical protein
MSRPLTAIVEPFDVFGSSDPSIPEVHLMPDESRRPKTRPARKTVAPLRPAVLRLTPDGAAYSSMSAKVLLRFHREGRLPLIKIGRRYWVAVADLDKLMADLSD